MQNMEKGKKKKWLKRLCVCGELFRNSVEKIKYRYFHSGILRFPFLLSSGTFILSPIYARTVVVVMIFSLFFRIAVVEIPIWIKEKQQKKNENFRIKQKRLVISCGYDVGITCDRWFGQNHHQLKSSSNLFCVRALSLSLSSHMSAYHLVNKIYSDFSFAAFYCFRNIE